MQTELNQLIAALPQVGILHAGKLGLALPANLSPELGQELRARVIQLTRSAAGYRHTLTAWLGDVLVQGGKLHRGQIATCAAAAGLDPGTLRNAKLVCTRIPVSCRHDALSWSHHCEVGLAFVTPADIECWLSTAEKEALPSSELRRRIRAHFASNPRVKSDAEHSAAFELMRELRAAARSADRRRGLWRHWPESTCKFALEEIRPLTELVDRLRARVGTPLHFVGRN